MPSLNAPCVARPKKRDGLVNPSPRNTCFNFCKCDILVENWAEINIALVDSAVIYNLLDQSGLVTLSSRIFLCACPAHEMTHAFDDNGINYNPDGVLSQLYDNFTIEAFHREAACLTNQYSQFKMAGKRKHSNWLFIRSNGFFHSVKKIFSSNFSSLYRLASSFQHFRHNKRNWGGGGGKSVFTVQCS